MFRTTFVLLFILKLRFPTLRKFIMSMNTSSRVGQCATAFSILSLFNYPLNETAHPPVSTAYSSKKNNTIRGIDTAIRVEILQPEHRLSC